MIKLFVSLFFIIICLKANSENIQIINDQPGTGTEIVNHFKIKLHYVGKLRKFALTGLTGALSWVSCENLILVQGFLHDPKICPNSV